MISALYWLAIVPPLLSAAAFFGPAEAQVVECPPRAEKLRELSEGFQEHVVLSAIVTENGAADGVPAALLDITASAGGSWTMLVTHPETGRSCVILSGGHLKIAPPPARVRDV